MARVKICGLRDAAMIEAAAEAGADMVGLVLLAESPRAVAREDARALAAHALSLPITPVLLLDPERDPLAALTPSADMAVQLHGLETPGDVARLAEQTPAQVIKALGVAAREDLLAASAYQAADMLLLDAKPPKNAAHAGGHGRAFDWSIVHGWAAPKPWGLAGGLTPDTVADAIAQTGAPLVDVSSGVESAPGVKDPIKIRDFVHAAKGL